MVSPLKIAAFFCFAVAGCTKVDTDIERPLNAYFLGYCYSMSCMDHLPQNLICCFA